MADVVLGKNYRPLCHVNGNLLAYHREALYLVDVCDFSANKICDFPIRDTRRFMCVCDLGERLAHVYAYCGIELNGGALVVFNRGIYFVDIINKRVTREHSFSISDMRRPLSLYKINNIRGFDDCVVYGDYSFNKKRCPMRIWKRNNNGGWEIAYEFPIGAIRHIHSIICDKFRERVIVLTGDFGDECAIWEFRKNFTEVKKILGSAQKYRACSARAYKEGLVIATDSPFDNNYVYLIKEKNDDIDIKILAEIRGPSVFFTYYKDKLVFSTDVEYDEITEKGLKQYITYKRGAGVKDWYSHVYMGNVNEGFKEIAKYKKDILPMVTFGFGQIEFPSGEVDGKIFFFPTALKRVNQKLSCLIFKKGEWINAYS